MLLKIADIVPLENCLMSVIANGKHQTTFASSDHEITLTLLILWSQVNDNILYADHNLCEKKLSIIMTNFRNNDIYVKGLNCGAMFN